MVKKCRICIVGAGNISNTRHIPAVKANRETAILAGVIGVSEKNVVQTATKHNIEHKYVINKEIPYLDQLEEIAWLKDIDAVIIGVPPREHYLLAKAFLQLGKHVLLEKPMVMNVDEAQDLIEIATKQNKILNVMHNFQYADNFVKMENRLRAGEFGDIISFFEIQFTNRERRLPEWYNDLPLGLFYDEAAHFLYLLERLGGNLEVLNSFAQYDQSVVENTPMLLSSNMRAGKYPVNLFINFNAPVCEWALIISCQKKLVIYDFFRDIAIILPNDQQHLAVNVITTSWKFTVQHWIKTVTNGFRMIRGKLYYGHDIVVRNFISGINTGNVDYNIDCSSGYKNIKAMNEIIELSTKLKG